MQYIFNVKQLNINYNEKFSETKCGYGSPQFTLTWITWEIKEIAKVQQDSKYETGWKSIKLKYTEAFGFSSCKLADFRIDTDYRETYDNCAFISQLLNY